MQALMPTCLKPSGKIIKLILISLIAVSTFFHLILIYRFDEKYVAGQKDAQKSAMAWKSGNPSKQQKIRKSLNQKADGTFNGYPIYYRDDHQPIHSAVQCIGENYREKAWISRSCKFRHFCFDTEAHDFVIYQSEEERALEEAMHSEFMDVSNRMNTTVSIGGINTKWRWTEGVPRLEWFPKVVHGELKESYYELDPNVVWIPFHSILAKNPGHLVWDEFLPIYNLLRIFDLLENYQSLLTRYILKGGRMWATCDMNDLNQRACAKMYSKFLPLMGLHNDNFTTINDFRFIKNNSTGKKSNLVCAAQGVAGIGMLTDHGTKLHGWHRKDYEVSHNHGRGALLYDFRNFMVSNLGLPIRKVTREPPYIITFSRSSTSRGNRLIQFNNYIQALNKEIGDEIIVREVHLSSHSLEDQVRIADESSIFISSCGGGAVTAQFLPEGASLILFYLEDGGVEDNKRTQLPARLDWDLFNNMGFIRVHWLPIGEMDTKLHIDTFVKLIRHEIDVLNDQILP